MQLVKCHLPYHNSLSAKYHVSIGGLPISVNALSCLNEAVRTRTAATCLVSNHVAEPLITYPSKGWTYGIIYPWLLKYGQWWESSGIPLHKNRLLLSKTCTGQALICSSAQRQWCHWAETDICRRLIGWKGISTAQTSGASFLQGCESNEMYAWW